MDSSEPLGAYVRAQEATVFRRLLWRRLALMTLAWLIGAWAMSLSYTAIVVGVATLAVPAAWSLSYERRSGRDLFSRERVPSASHPDPVE